MSSFRWWIPVCMLCLCLWRRRCRWLPVIVTSLRLERWCTSNLGTQSYCGLRRWLRRNNSIYTSSLTCCLSPRGKSKHFTSALQTCRIPILHALLHTAFLLTQDLPPHLNVTALILIFKDKMGNRLFRTCILFDSSSRMVEQPCTNNRRLSLNALVVTITNCHTNSCFSAVGWRNCAWCLGYGVPRVIVHYPWTISRVDLLIWSCCLCVMKLQNSIIPGPSAELWSNCKRAENGTLNWAQSQTQFIQLGSVWAVSSACLTCLSEDDKYHCYLQGSHVSWKVLDFLSVEEWEPCIYPYWVTVTVMLLDCGRDLYDVIVQSPLSRVNATELSQADVEKRFPRGTPSDCSNMFLVTIWRETETVEYIFACKQRFDNHHVFDCCVRLFILCVLKVAIPVHI